MVADTPTENEARQSNLETLATCRVVPSPKSTIDEYTIDSLLSQVWGVHREPSESASKLKPNKENRHPAYRIGQGTYEGIANVWAKWAMKFDFDAVRVYYNPLNQMTTTTMPVLKTGKGYEVIDHDIRYVKKDSIQRRFIPNADKNMNTHEVTAMSRYPMFKISEKLCLYPHNKIGHTAYDRVVKMTYDGLNMTMVMRKSNGKLIMKRSINGVGHVADLIESTKSKNKNGYMTYGMQACPAYTFANLFVGIRTARTGNMNGSLSLRRWVDAVVRYTGKHTEN